MCVRGDFEQCHDLFEYCCIYLEAIFMLGSYNFLFNVKFPEIGDKMAFYKNVVKKFPSLKLERREGFTFVNLYYL